MRHPAHMLLVFCALLAIPATGCDSADESRESEERGAVETVTVPKGIAGTTTVEESGSAAARSVEQTVGREVAAGQPAVIGARCEAGRCVVRYRSEPRGAGVVLEEQSGILRRLFADDSVRSVALYVHHKTSGAAGKDEAAAFATTKCKRRNHPRFAWARISAAQIPRRCQTTHVAGGRQRSLIRRGKLSSEEASRGKGVGGPPPGKGGGPPRRSGGGPPGQAKKR